MAITCILNNQREQSSNRLKSRILKYDGYKSTSSVNFGLPRHYKFTTSADFKRIMQGGAKRFSSITFLLLVKRNQRPHARLGVIVSKKACRKATQRNRVKRLLRESFRLNAYRFPAIDIVILIKKGQSIPDNPYIFQELEELWQTVEKKYGN